MRHHSTSIVGPDIDKEESCCDCLGTHRRPTTKEGMREFHKIERGFPPYERMHCDDGPAYWDNTGYVEYWLDGVQVTHAQWEARRKKPKSSETPKCEYAVEKEAQNSKVVADPYPADVLAACPLAREWGVVLWEGDDMFEWRTSNEMYHHGQYGWIKAYWKKAGIYTKRKKALANPPTTPPPGYVTPAQPSVGERLGLVSFYTDPGVSHGKNWEELSPEVRLSYTKIALAVRREVLREDFTDEDIQAARREHERQWGTGGTSPSFCMKHALSAALASRVKRAEREGSNGH